MKVTIPLYVSDLAPALVFFESLELFKINDLSIEILHRADVEVSVPGLCITLSVEEPQSNEGRAMIGQQALPGRCFLYLGIPAFHSWHERMVSKGVLISEVKSFPFASVAVVRDPAGNSYLFSSSTDNGPE